MEGSATRRRPGRSPRPGPARCTGTTTITSPSTVPRSCPPDDRPSGSRPTDGASTTWARWPTTRHHRGGLAPGPGRRGPPQPVVLRSHIGWPSPHMTDNAKAHGSLSARRRSGDQGDPGSPTGRDVLGARRGPRLIAGCIPRGQAGAGATGRSGCPPGPATRGVGRPGGAGAGPAGKPSLLCSTPGEACGDPPAPSTPPSMPPSGWSPASCRWRRPDRQHRYRPSTTPIGRAREHPGAGPSPSACGSTAWGDHQRARPTGGAIPIGGTFFVFSDYMRGRCVWPPCPAPR